MLNSTISISHNELTLALPFVSFIIIILNFNWTWLGGCLACGKLLILYDSIVWLNLVIVWYCYTFQRLVVCCENIWFLLCIAGGKIFLFLLIIILIIIVTYEARCSFMWDNSLMGIVILFLENIVERQYNLFIFRSYTFRYFWW